MPWRPPVGDRVADVIRAVAAACVLLIGVWAGAAACYVIGKAFWFGIQFVNRTWFRAPW